MSNQALIIVDIQNDYFADGKWPMHKMDEATENAVQILNAFRAQNKPVFHVQHIAPAEGSPFFAEGTKGADIHTSVTPQNDEPVFVKNTINPFTSTSLLEALQEQNIKDVVVVGAMSHMCIDATARAAKDYGFNVIVVEDACAARDLEFDGDIVPAEQVHKGFMSALGFAYANVLTTDKFLSV